MTFHHHDPSAAAATSPLPARLALCQTVHPGVRRVVGLVAIPAVLMISGEVGAP